LKEELGLNAELIVGHSGIFEVAVDGKVVAAKTRAGFPSPQEVVDAVSRAVDAAAPPARSSSA
jgi:selenoprotein W-related protein